MNPRRRSPASSFELLLDPICNTFGCVIFLCMLVSLLVQNSSERLQQLAQQFVSPLEAGQLRLRHQELQLQQEQLQTDLQHLERVVAQQLSPESFSLAKEIQQLQNHLDYLQAQLQRLRQTKTQTRQNIQQLQEEKNLLRTQTKQTEDQLKKLEKQLEAEIAERTQTIPLPKERQTTKRGVALDLRYGRLYVWHRYDAQGDRIGLNTDEYVVVEETPEHILTAPKPYAGVSLDDPSAEMRITARLQQFPPRDWFLDFSIFPDSFEHFQKLKRIIVKLGYDYRLLLMAEGQIVYDRGGKDAKVQ